MSKWTPGPWKPFVLGATFEVQDATGAPVVKWTGFDGSDRPEFEQEANARLIARAPLLPEMAEALRPFAEIGLDLTEAFCHRGLCSAEKCIRCSRVLQARVALARYDDEAAP